MPTATISVFKNDLKGLPSYYLKIYIYLNVALFVMWQKFQEEQSWTVIRLWCHPYNMIKWTLLVLMDKKHYKTFEVTNHFKCVSRIWVR